MASSGKHGTAEGDKPQTGNFWVKRYLCSGQQLPSMCVGVAKSGTSMSTLQPTLVSPAAESGRIATLAAYRHLGVTPPSSTESFSV